MVYIFDGTLLSRQLPENFRELGNNNEGDNPKGLHILHMGARLCWVGF